MIEKSAVRRQGICVMRYIFNSAFALVGAALLSACASHAGRSPPAHRYRCEHGLEFSARFSGESVALDTTRGYELLFRDAKPLPNPPKPNEYRNPFMSAEFNLGKDGNEALLRYPSLPLAARCVESR
jgi:hypothetical protein